MMRRDFRRLWRSSLSRILAITAGAALLLPALSPPLTALSEGENSPYPVVYTVVDFDKSSMDGWHNIGMGGAALDAGKSVDGGSSLHFPAADKQSAWCDALNPIRLSAYYQAEEEMAFSFWVYAGPADTDLRLILKDGAGNRAYIDFMMTDIAPVAGKWHQVIIRPREMTGSFLWESGLQQWALERSGGTTDLWVDRLELIRLPYNPYKVKQVLADDGIKVSGGLEDTSRSFSGAQSYGFYSESASQKPVIYASPNIDLSLCAASLDELAISFFVYTDSPEVDGQYAFEIASGGSWDNAMRVLSYAKKSSFAPNPGVWQQVLIPLGEAARADGFDFTNVTQWRLRLQVPASNGSAATPDTLCVDKVEIVTLKAEMEAALGYYGVLKVLEDVEKGDFIFQNAAFEYDQAYKGKRSFLLTAEKGDAASVAGTFGEPVDLRAFAAQGTAMSLWLAAEGVTDAPVTLVLSSAEGSLTLTAPLSSLLAREKQWRQAVFPLEEGLASGRFDEKRVTGWRLEISCREGGRSSRLYMDEMGLAEIPRNPYPVKYTFADFDAVLASFSNASLTGEFRRQGGYGALMSPESGKTASIYKGIDPIKLSDYADQMNKLAISFWVYTDAVGEDVEFMFSLGSGGTWANVWQMSYIFKDSYAPTAGQWYHVLLRLADGKMSDAFDWNDVTMWRFEQHNMGEKPAYNLYVDEIQLVEVPIWTDPGPTENLVHVINTCDSTKVGVTNGGTTPTTYVRGPQSLRLTTGNAASSMWYAPGAKVNLSSLLYDFDDLALSVWLMTDTLADDAQLTFRLWSDGGNDSKNNLLWTVGKGDVLDRKGQWTRVLLKFSDASGDGGFDMSRYAGYSLSVTPRGGARSNLYVDEVEIVSLKPFGESDFVTLTVDKTAAEVGDDIKATLTLKNSLDKTMTDLRYQVRFNGLMLSTTGPLTGSLTLQPGESKSYTFSFRAKEGGAAVLTASLTAEGVTIVSQARADIAGKGFYWGDGHTHSTRSDGTGTLYENFLSAYTKGHSFILATDHNANPGEPADVAEALTALRKELANPTGFIALKNNEITATPNGHMLQYNTPAPYQPQTSAEGWARVIGSIKADGGLSFLAHPFDEPWIYSGLESPANVIPESAEVTGFEIVNGTIATRAQNRMAQELWDRYNISGWKRYVGVVNTDGHTKDQVAEVFNALLMDSLSEENIYDAYANGRLYASTGPQLRYTLGGADMGGTAYIPGDTGEAALDVTAMAEDGAALTKVVAYRYTVSDTVEGIEAAYRKGRSAPIVLYEQGDGEPLAFFRYGGKLTVGDGEFIRVEVHAQKGVDTLVAFSNPIWVEKRTADTDRAEALLAQAGGLDAGVYVDVAGVDAAAQALRDALADGSSQEAIDTLADALEAALEALAYKPADYSALDKVLAGIPEDLSLFTDETAEALRTVLDGIARDKNITEQSVVDSWTRALKAAAAGLELKGGESTATESATGPTTATAGGSQVETGEKPLPALLTGLLLTLLSGAAFTLSWKRKRDTV